MAIELNSAALNIYRNAAFAEGKTILNNDGDGIKANGVYSGALSALTRSSGEKAANNVARTELLKALGRAFNVKGMTEEGCKVIFSKDFMVRLEKILGADFKRGDFGINADGEVTSGKPLTMRRVQAIVKKADLVGNGSFSLPIYEQKLDMIKAELGYGKISADDFKKMAKQNQVARAFLMASNILEFLKHEADQTLGLNPEYEFALECDEEFNGPKLQYFDRVAGENKPFSDLNDYDIYLQSRIGVVMHFENAGYDRTNPETIGKLKTYITGIAQLYLKRVVDNYLDAKAEGKVPEYLDHINKNSGVCLEDRCGRLDEFVKDHLVKNDAMDIAAAAEAKRVADTALNGGELSTAENLIYGVFEQFEETDKEVAVSDNWEDYSEKTKALLVGKMATITVPKLQDDKYVFEPVMEDGKAVVRPLTAEDIDLLGPACLANVFGAV